MATQLTSTTTTTTNLNAITTITPAPPKGQTRITSLSENAEAPTTRQLDSLPEPSREPLSLSDLNPKPLPSVPKNIGDIPAQKQPNTEENESTPSRLDRPKEDSPAKSSEARARAKAKAKRNTLLKYLGISRSKSTEKTDLFDQLKAWKNDESKKLKHHINHYNEKPTEEPTEEPTEYSTKSLQEYANTNGTPLELLQVTDTDKKDESSIFWCTTTLPSQYSKPGDTHVQRLEQFFESMDNIKLIKLFKSEQAQSLPPPKTAPINEPKATPELEQPSATEINTKLQDDVTSTDDKDAPPQPSAQEKAADESKATLELQPPAAADISNVKLQDSVTSTNDQDNIAPQQSAQEMLIETIAVLEQPPVACISNTKPQDSATSTDDQNTSATPTQQSMTEIRIPKRQDSVSYTDDQDTIAPQLTAQDKMLNGSEATLKREQQPAATDTSNVKLKATAPQKPVRTKVPGKPKTTRVVKLVLKQISVTEINKAKLQNDAVSSDDQSATSSPHPAQEKKLKTTMELQQAETDRNEDKSTRPKDKSSSTAKQEIQKKSKASRLSSLLMCCSRSEKADDNLSIRGQDTAGSQQSTPEQAVPAEKTAPLAQPETSEMLTPPKGEQ